LLIEQRLWRQESPKWLLSIAFRAGLLTWGVIVIITVIGRYGYALQSLAALVQMDMSTSIGDEANATQAWRFLPTKMMTASFWFLAGAVTSAILANRIGGDIRRTQISDRLRDAAYLGLGLGLAVMLAQLMQSALADKLGDMDRIPLSVVPVVAFIGVLCGCVIGFMIPYACKSNLSSPSDPKPSRELRNLLAEAQDKLGNKAAAEDWVFRPQQGLRGISPAEAIQYNGYANLVRSLLVGDNTRRTQEPASMREDRPAPVSVDGILVPIVPAPAAATVGQPAAL
jgi:hypothetical protein